VTSVPAILFVLRVSVTVLRLTLARRVQRETNQQ